MLYYDLWPSCYPLGYPLTCGPVQKMDEAKEESKHENNATNHAKLLPLEESDEEVSCGWKGGPQMVVPIEGGCSHRAL
jgi:hypothetical protein